MWRIDLEPLLESVRRKPFPWHCVQCGQKEVYSAVIAYAAKINHDGRLYELDVPDLQAARCRACGEVVFDDFADEQISQTLRAHLRLLTPEQIRGAVESLGMRQKELAACLGVAEATVSRWCTGALIQ
jgi:hypothetical protein